MKTAKLPGLLLDAAAILLLYPSALAFVLVSDSLLGNAEFIRMFLYVSKKQAVLTVLSDWLMALPVCLLIWIGARLLLRIIGLTSATILTTITALALWTMVFLPPYLPMIFASLLTSTIVFILTYARVTPRSTL